MGCEVLQKVAARPAESGLSLSCFKSFTEAAPWREALDAINSGSSRPDPFSTFGFLEHYHQYDEYFPGGRGFTLWLLVVFRGKEPIGYLPLKHTEERVLGLQASKVSFLVLHDTDRPHLVARAADEPAVATACFRWLADHSADWSLLEFHQQEARSPLAQLPPELPVSRYRLAHWECHENSTLRIRWPSLAAYYAELSPNLRSSLSRLSRRLSETGCTEVVSSRDPACLPALFELYLEVEERSWKANVGAGVCRSPLRENYMRELMRNRSLLEVDIKILLLDGVAISGIMTGAFGNSRYLLQLSYDAALAKLGPGSPMLALCVRDSLLEGRTEFNFLNGFAFYKTRWLADVTPTRIMQIYRRGSLPDWRRRVGDLKRRLERRQENQTPIYGNPQRIAAEQGGDPVEKAAGETLWQACPARAQATAVALQAAEAAGTLQRLAAADWLRLMPGKQFRPD
jgi:hypothetical protein